MRKLTFLFFMLLPFFILMISCPTDIENLSIRNINGKSNSETSKEDYYTILFKLNGGHLEETKKIVAYNETVNLPEPEREGYVFGGYFLDSTFNLDKKLGYTVKGLATEGSVKIYAKWIKTENALFITFNSNTANTETYVQPIEKNKKDKLIENTFTRLGYEFAGWSENADETYNSKKLITDNAVFLRSNDTTLYAIWKPNSYTVLFISNNGNYNDENFTESKKVFYNEKWLLPKIPVKTGYKFTGWSLSPKENDSIIFNSTDIYGSDLSDKNNAEIRLYAHYTPNSYTIYFDSDGGSYIDSVSVKYGEIKSLPTPIKPGYRFLGWQAPDGEIFNQTLDKDYVTGGKNKDKVILTAEWEKIKIFSLYADINSEAKKIKYNEETDLSTLRITVNYDGYSEIFNYKDYTSFFVCQLDSTEIGNDRVLKIWYDNKSSEIFTAITGFIITEPKEFNISYNLNGGYFNQNENPVVYSILSPNFTLINPTKTGYTFKGWSGTDLIGNDNTNVTVKTETKGNKEYTANWTANTYTVTFSGNAENYILPGHTVLNESEIKFGNQNTSKTVVFDSSYGTLPVPIRTGWIFMNWSKIADSSNNTSDNIVDSDTKVTFACDHTLYAQWTPEKYNITITKGEHVTGVIGETDSAYFGDIITLSATEFDDGYEFNSWAVISGYIMIYENSFYMPDTDVKVSVSAKPIRYSIKYNDADKIYNPDSLPSYYTVEDEVIINKPHRYAYVFDGWSGDDIVNLNDTIKIEKGTTGNKEYTANWSIMVVFREIGNSFLDSTNILNNSEIVLPPASYLSPTGNGNMYKLVKYGREYGVLPIPTRKGWTFAGWYTDSVFSEKVTQYTTVKIDGHHNLYSKWEPVKYTLKIKLIDFYETDNDRVTIGTRVNEKFTNDISEYEFTAFYGEEIQIYSGREIEFSSPDDRLRITMGIKGLISDHTLWIEQSHGMGHYSFFMIGKDLSLELTFKEEIKIF